MRKKILAVVLMAALMLSLIPMASAAINLNDVRVFNYNQSNNLYTFDPAYTGSSYAVIQAPYDQIAKSTADGTRASAPYYRVLFYLDKDLRKGYDYAYMSDQTTRAAVNLDGVAHAFARYEDGVVQTVFTPVPGGNTKTYTLEVYEEATRQTRYYYFTVQYIDTASAQTINPATGKVAARMNVTAAMSSTYYTAYTSGSTLYIDYNSAYVLPSTQINVNFTFTDQNGTPIPGGINEGFINNVSSNGNMPFIYSYNYDRSGYPQRGRVYGNSIDMPVNVDFSTSAFTMGMETSTTIYTSYPLSVVWRNTNNAATSTLDIQPSRTPVLAVGQEYTFSIATYNAAATGSSFFLEVGGTTGIVTTATGKFMTVKALNPGTTYLNVRNSAGAVVDRIDITVLAATSATSTAVATQSGTYSVTASSLNVRSGPGTGFARIGSLAYGANVSVKSIASGWAQINWASGTAYVAAAYLRAVAVTTATPSVTATTTPAVSGASGVVGLPDTTSIVGSVVGTGGPAVGTSSNIIVPAGGMGFVFNRDTFVYSDPGSWNYAVDMAYTGTAVLCTAIDNNGWAAISWKGSTRYVPYDSLSK